MSFALLKNKVNWAKKQPKTICCISVGMGRGVFPLFTKPMEWNLHAGLAAPATLK